MVVVETAMEVLEACTRMTMEVVESPMKAMGAYMVLVEVSMDVVGASITSTEASSWKLS